MPGRGTFSFFLSFSFYVTIAQRKKSQPPHSPHNQTEMTHNPPFIILYLKIIIESNILTFYLDINHIVGFSDYNGVINVNWLIIKTCHFVVSD